jgi:hypothetical protein
MSLLDSLPAPRKSGGLSRWEQVGEDAKDLVEAPAEPEESILGEVCAFLTQVIKFTTHKRLHLSQWLLHTHALVGAEHYVSRFNQGRCLSARIR